MLDPAEPSHFALGYLPLLREEGEARPECGFPCAPFFQLFLVHAAPPWPGRVIAAASASPITPMKPTMIPFVSGPALIMSKTIHRTRAAHPQVPSHDFRNSIAKACPVSQSAV